ncbi:MAG: DUF4912 domain-containing protein [Cyanobacteria bacterium P01_D01_bin.73]
MSSNNPRPPLEEMTLRQLRRVASELSISRYSRMRKHQLLESIRQKLPAASLPQAGETAGSPQSQSQPQPSQAVEPASAIAPPPMAEVDGMAATPEKTAPTVQAATPQASTSTTETSPSTVATPVKIPAMSTSSTGSSQSVNSPSVPETSDTIPVQESVEATKFDVGVPETTLTMEELATVDEDLAELPDGYGKSTIALMPRDPQWSYVYWDVPNDHKAAMRQQGGQQLALRIYDVTGIDINHQRPHSLQEHACDELAREWYLPLPVSDRDYIAEIGYRCGDGRWLMLARSATVRVPPVFPSDWIEDIFVTVTWDQNLRGGKIATLVPPSEKALTEAANRQGQGSVHGDIYALSEEAEALRVAGSLPYGSHVVGSVQHLDTLSSYVFPSGVGMWASGAGLAGVTGMSGAGLANFSGAGFSASAPPIRPRSFWLVADAELIVYGATEPDATVTIAGRPIKLNSDGTFRFQMSFQDGVIDYPIMAVAADGEQTRSIHMKFERQTLSRNTNTKAEAPLEWLV